MPGCNVILSALCSGGCEVLKTYDERLRGVSRDLQQVLSVRVCPGSWIDIDSMSLRVVWLWAVTGSMLDIPDVTRNPYSMRLTHAHKYSSDKMLNYQAVYFF